jgi:hypothetical protein
MEERCFILDVDTALRPLLASRALRDLVCKMGANPIIFTGQDFAYSWGRDSVTRFLTANPSMPRERGLNASSISGPRRSY